MKRLLALLLALLMIFSVTACSKSDSKKKKANTSSTAETADEGAHKFYSNDDQLVFKNSSGAYQFFFYNKDGKMTGAELVVKKDTKEDAELYSRVYDNSDYAATYPEITIRKNIGFYEITLKQSEATVTVWSNLSRKDLTDSFVNKQKECGWKEQTKKSK